MLNVAALQSMAADYQSLLRQFANFAVHSDRFAVSNPHTGMTVEKPAVEKPDVFKFRCLALRFKVRFTAQFADQLRGAISIHVRIQGKWEKVSTCEFDRYGSIWIDEVEGHMEDRTPRIILDAIERAVHGAMLPA